MPSHVETNELGGKIFFPFIMKDNRGTFIKDFQYDELKNIENLQFDIKEVLNVTSNKGVLRGLHYQRDDPQAKIVRCIRGHIYDVMVDIRPNSPTFGQYVGYHLTETNNLMLYIPKGFAHGYLVLEDNTEVIYYCDASYNDSDMSISYNDNIINIDWPFDLIGGEENIILSAKDSAAYSLSILNKMPWSYRMLPNI